VPHVLSADDMVLDISTRGTSMSCLPASQLSIGNACVLLRATSPRAYSASIARLAVVTRRGHDAVPASVALSRHKHAPLRQASMQPVTTCCLLRTTVVLTSFKRPTPFSKARQHSRFPVTCAAGALYAPAGRVVGCQVWSCLGSADGHHT
jgi:hypothetical protein